MPVVRSLLLALLLVLSALAATATAAGRFRIVPDAPGPGVPGAMVRWSLEGSLGEERRFFVVQVGHGLRVFSDFSEREQLDWTPVEGGLYLVGAVARGGEDGRRQIALALYRVKHPEAEVAVLPTEHPLVFLYAARVPEALKSEAREVCGRRFADCEMIVNFSRVGSSRVVTTPPQLVSPHRPTTAVVAGLREGASYDLWHVIRSVHGRILDIGKRRRVRAGEASFEPPVSVPLLGSLLPDLSERAPIVLTGPIVFGQDQDRAGIVPYAIDLEGRLVWYDPHPGAAMLTRLTGEGTLLELRGGRTVREIDLLGNIVRETSLDRINEQLAERGAPPVFNIHHEARRLPDGRTVVLGYLIEIREDVQGPGPVAIAGDAVLVLDSRFQVEWFWNAFEHLDVRRRAILDEACEGGCIAADPGLAFHDWTHTNAVDYLPDDGSLILSVRHQDWVIKIDYADGHGDGRILWRLGRDGDFTLDSGDEWAWFSHQHDAHWVDERRRRLILYDNGNTRCALTKDCRSRGQVYEIDETTREAHLLYSLPLQGYSFALGSAEVMPGGQLHFGSGLASGPSGPGSLAEAFATNGAPTFVLYQAARAYRSYRLPDLYSRARGSLRLP